MNEIFEDDYVSFKRKGNLSYTPNNLVVKENKDVDVNSVPKSNRLDEGDEQSTGEGTDTPEAE